MFSRLRLQLCRNITSDINQLVLHVCAPQRLRAFDLKLVKDVVVGPSITHTATNHRRCLLNSRNRKLINTPVDQRDPPTQCKRVPKLDRSDTCDDPDNSSDACDDMDTTGTDSSHTSNHVDTDSSDTGTDIEDCPLYHLAQERNNGIFVLGFPLQNTLMMNYISVIFIHCLSRGENITK